MKPLLLAILALLLLSACAGGGSSPTEPSDPLRAASHMNINLQAIAQSWFWTRTMGILIAIMAIMAIIATFTDTRGAWKWLGVMLLTSLWLVLGTLVMRLIEGAWPDALNQELVNATIGQGTGIVPGGDVSPWSVSFVETTINTACMMLWLTHGIAVIWFLFLPIPWLLENVVDVKHFKFIVIGIWGAFALTRALTPRMLLTITEAVYQARAQPSPIPVIGDLEAAATNTLNQLNLRFIGGWWGAIFFMFVIFFSLFAALAKTFVPRLVQTGTTIYRDVRKTQKEAQRRAKEEGRRQDAETDKQLLHEMSTQLDATDEAVSRVEKRLEENERLQQGQRSASQSGQSGGSSGSQQGQSSTRGPRTKARETGENAERAEEAAREAGDAAAQAQAAAEGAEQAYPEADVPMTAAGSPAAEDYNGPTRTSSLQDPDMAKRQHEADKAVADFENGGET